MAHRIRRTSMENLVLYDLDKLKPKHQLPPPLPPPRKSRRHLPPGFAFERYQFLCDMKRHKTDPIYAATPMFTTIPQSVHIKHQRQLLGSHVPSKIVTPLSTKSPASAEPESAKPDNATEDKSSDEDDDKKSDNDDDNTDDDDDNDNDDDGRGNQSSSSSSSDDNDDDDILDDDDNKQGIVEQIFNRNQK